MNSKYAAIVIVVFVLIFGAIKLFSNPGNTNQTQPTRTANLTTDETSQEPKDSDKYILYSSNALENNPNKRRVLYFYASWCPTCRPADADFKANTDKIPGDVVLIRVNYNDPDTDSEEKALANKYVVTYQHTFVQIDSEGNEVTKWNGGQTEELLNRIQ